MGFYCWWRFDRGWFKLCVFVERVWITFKKKEVNSFSTVNYGGYVLCLSNLALKKMISILSQ